MAELLQKLHMDIGSVKKQRQTEWPDMEPSKHLFFVFYPVPK